MEIFIFDFNDTIIYYPFGVVNYDKIYLATNNFILNMLGMGNPVYMFYNTFINHCMRAIVGDVGSIAMLTGIAMVMIEILNMLIEKVLVMKNILQLINYINIVNLNILIGLKLVLY